MPDHLHILIGLKAAMALADLVRDIKSDSSEGVNKKKLARGGKFAWQEGYGAFSYGHSQLDTIVRYIMNQERHHRRRSFRDEYLTLLRKFEIDFKERIRLRVLQLERFVHSWMDKHGTPKGVRDVVPVRAL